MPPESSTAAPEVDRVFFFIYWVSVFFFVLIVALMVYFVIRYRRRREGERATSRVTHSTPLELTWSAIPLLLVIVMFYMGFRGYMDMVSPPVNAMNIYVTGQKWFWNFEYPGGHQDTELHVPVDTPVQLTLVSTDVIHSFYIPAFRLKKDAVPGRYNKAWFEAHKPGDYLALCAEYCGTSHSDMLARVVVHPPGEFEKWLSEAADPFRTRSFAEVGALIFVKRCSGCHTTDGSIGTGPSFKRLFGDTVHLSDGSTLIADENYIRESIVDPHKQIVQGYAAVMPTFKGQLSDRDITAIIEYIKELSGIKSTLGAPEAAAEAAEPAAQTQPAVAP